MHKKYPISKVFVFLTPFHFLSASSIFGDDLLSNDEYLFIVHDRVSLKTTPRHLFLFGDELSFKNINSTKFWEISRKIKRIGNWLADIFTDYNLSETTEFISGSDKEVICQMIINRLTKKVTSQVTVIDEGIGMYACLDRHHRLKNFIYKSASCLIFGEKIEFVKPIGSNSSTDKIYLRNPSMLCHRSKSKVYSQFELKKNTINIQTSIGKNVLIFTSPQDMNLISAHDIFAVISKISESMDSKNMRVFIKPHPREDTDYSNYFKRDNIQIIDKKICGDNLNFSQFDLIVHFQSSTVIEVLASGFPPDKIITIKYFKSKGLDQFFENTISYSISEFLNSDFSTYINDR